MITVYSNEVNSIGLANSFMKSKNEVPRAVQRTVVNQITIPHGVPPVGFGIECLKGLLWCHPTRLKLGSFGGERDFFRRRKGAGSTPGSFVCNFNERSGSGHLAASFYFAEESARQERASDKTEYEGAMVRRKRHITQGCNYRPLVPELVDRWVPEAGTPEQ
ncbi:hypothetical protein ZHAS_00007545 [Anopheles sinensis]|uniref:Uncharacterized protein n=1 Tax=Anopheles sinensis TaxID=74873 RepID=A0A084VQ34_ANOSI|nr:hypothetical protein ZHAS_00007545 [Anopheles sinensis]